MFKETIVLYDLAFGLSDLLLFFNRIRLFNTHLLTPSSIACWVLVRSNFGLLSLILVEFSSISLSELTWGIAYHEISTAVMLLVEELSSIAAFSEECYAERLDIGEWQVLPQRDHDSSLYNSLRGLSLHVVIRSNCKVTSFSINIR
jgi:hypothetical protein